MQNGLVAALSVIAAAPPCGQDDPGISVSNKVEKQRGNEIQKLRATEGNEFCHGHEIENGKFCGEKVRSRAK